ncbi:MAG TPA: hypothetical protein VGL72_01850 [Bryobacteraceae bacterium]|jgi:hypothetical protein
MRKITLALLAFAMSALAADFTGNWSGEGVANGESHPLYFVLKQDGNNLTGTGGPNASEQHPFQNGKVDGDKIVFDVVPGEKGSIHFELKKEGEGLKGTVELRREDGKESGTVTLKKES